MFALAYIENQFNPFDQLTDVLTIDKLRLEVFLLCVLTRVERERERESLAKNLTSIRWTDLLEREAYMRDHL